MSISSAKSSSCVDSDTYRLMESNNEMERTRSTTDNTQLLFTEDDAELEIIEYMETGKIKSYVYFSYFKAAGYIMSILVLLTTFLMQGSSTIMALWWSEWAQNSDNYTTNQFLYITCVIAGVNLLCALIRSFLFAYAGLQAATNMYNQLIESLFRTSLYFFETTSLGKIVNRFGKDTFCVDDQLPFILNIVLAQVFLLLGSFVIMLYSDLWVIIIIIPIGIAYYRMQRFYRSSSRMLRRLDSTYKSPVYSIICDCTANVICLRSLGYATIDYFKKRLVSALDDSLQVNLSLNVASQVYIVL